MFDLTAKDFEEMKEESRLARLQHWRRWLPTITTDIRDTTGKLAALLADLARAMDRKDPGTELVKLKPRVAQMLEECYTMLGQIRGNLAGQLLDEDPSSSIFQT